METVFDCLALKKAIRAPLCSANANMAGNIDGPSNIIKTNANMYSGMDLNISRNSLINPVNKPPVNGLNDNTDAKTDTTPLHVGLLFGRSVPKLAIYHAAP